MLLTKLILENVAGWGRDRNISVLQTKLILEIFTVWRFQETGMGYRPNWPFRSLVGGEWAGMGHRPNWPFRSLVGGEWAGMGHRPNWPLRSLVGRGWTGMSYRPNWPF